MPNLNYATFDPYRLRNNFETINNYIKEDHYKRFITPNDFYIPVGSAGVALQAISSRWVALVFPATGLASSAVYASIRSNSLWIDGSIEVTIYYADDVAGGTGGIVVWGFLAARGNDPVSTSLFNVSETSPGPSGAAISTDIFSQKISVSGSEKLYSIRLTRNDASPTDTCTNDVGILGVELRYIPNKE